MIPQASIEALEAAARESVSCGLNWKALYHAKNRKGVVLAAVTPATRTSLRLWCVYVLPQYSPRRIERCSVRSP